MSQADKPTEDDRSFAQLVAFLNAGSVMFLLKELGADFGAAKWEINMASTAQHI